MHVGNVFCASSLLSLTETEPSPAGPWLLGTRSLALLARERTYIPFPSLEGSFVVIDDRQSALLAYHQSYAMVAASLEADPRALERAVAHLRAGGDPEDVLAAMSDRPLDGPALLAWIDARAE